MAFGQWHHMVTHKLVLFCVVLFDLQMISTKFYAGHDERFYLEDWAKEGNMTEDKLKQLELEFLTAIVNAFIIFLHRIVIINCKFCLCWQDWKIYISNEQFFEKLSSVERTLAQREGLRRGWLTYSELMQLLPSFTLMKFLLNNLAVLALSYAASVFTIAGAFFIASQLPGTLWHRRSDIGNATAPVNPTLNPLKPIVTPNATDAAPVGLATRAGAARNDSCNALNVEAELMKLEQQYCDEERLIALQRRQREERPPNPLLPPKYRMDYATKQQDNTEHWLNIKSQYSDQRHSANNWNWNETRNTSVFWQVLSEAISHQSFLVRWPELWPKFI